MPNQAALAREAQAAMSHMAGRRYPAFFRELENLPVEALIDLLRFLRDFEGELDRERRTFRPFPGGPKFRM
jgi:hypothetical protein